MARKMEVGDEQEEGWIAAGLACCPTASPHAAPLPSQLNAVQSANKKEH